jgi:hypothetical protein
VIAGERSASRIRAVQPRRESDDQQSWIRVTERWYRRAVIAGMVPSRLVEERGETRAATAARIEEEPRAGWLQPCADLNCSSSVEPLSATTDDAPPCITVVTSSK